MVGFIVILFIIPIVVLLSFLFFGFWATIFWLFAFIGVVAVFLWLARFIRGS